VDWTTLEATDADKSFSIVESSAGQVPNAAVSVDSATCDDCLSEVDDPGNRRYRYPFTNCTNCGPRYTIVISVPYDRPATTMAPFKMCPDCQAEYDDPANRRFHAQPNACATCGPQIAFYNPSGELNAEADEALDRVVKSLCAGHILAIKGIGGYHLATDATNAGAVAELRRRKARDDKPFALMVSDLEMARSLCVLDPQAETTLSSTARPIVLAQRRPGNTIANEVAPNVQPWGDAGLHPLASPDHGQGGSAPGDEQRQPL
jgi:hydrogenase maturation protein HypF